MHIVQKRGDVVMSKRKKFLSLLMGAISSLSIAGAKVRKNESKESISISTSQTKNAEDCNSKNKSNQELKNESKIEVSPSKKFAERIKDEIFPNLDNLSNLEDKDDTEVFTSMFEGEENENFKKKFIDLAEKGDFGRASNMIISRFNSVYKKQIISDLDKTVNDVSYGVKSRWTCQGCCVSLKSAKSRLGKDYYYELSDLHGLDIEKSNTTVLRTVLSHLMISDLRKLEDKSYEEKSGVELMKQIILSTYVSKDDSLDQVSSSLSKKVNFLINSTKKKVTVWWLKEAKDAVIKDRFGSAWNINSNISQKAVRGFLGHFGFARTFDTKNKLNFVIKLYHN